MSWLITGAAAAIVVTVGSMVAQRFVLHMAPPADSPTRVQWEDAVRGLALRDLGVTGLGVCIALGVVATHTAATDLLVGAPDAARVAMYVASGLGILALTALIVVTEGTKAPARRFLRLYGDAATGGQR